MRSRLIPSKFSWMIALCCTVSVGHGADLKITRFDPRTTLGWTNAFTNGVLTVETRNAIQDPWRPDRNFFTSTSASNVSVLMAPSIFVRLAKSDTSATSQGFTNLAYSYGLLDTIAGAGGGRTDVISFWNSSFEGGPATAANLSRPHFAMADRAGMIYIADKNSHSILKITLDGAIHTFAGSHVGGFNGDGPAPATSLQLNFPNGEWVRADGTVYILDAGNGRVRKVNTNGVMTTLIKDPAGTNGINTGRGLWVKDDESLAYYCAGTSLKKWTQAGGITTLVSGFVDLGNLVLDPKGQLVVTDRGSHLVYRVAANGTRVVIAGNGTISGGGDGFTALQTGLYGVRGVWFIPTGGYLLATHEGSQVWYVDAAGIIHLFVNGSPNYHFGDGSFFFTAGLTISEPRSVTLDYDGNMLITENDYGYVRRIRFLRMTP